MKLFPAQCIHDELGSLVDIEIDILSPVEGQIMRVDALLSFLAEALLEIGADHVSWIFFLLLLISMLVDVIEE